MDASDSLVRDVAEGCTTLVLGAGVAGACNVATWRELARRLWQEAFGTDLPAVADDPRFNIWRWLAMRAFEIAADCKSLREAQRGLSEDRLRELHDRSLHRHYWITSEEEKETEFLSHSLALRGVRTVRITRWSDDSLHRLMAACFPEPKS
jgi:hypothetical protein